jgi:hypothetical protein
MPDFDGAEHRDEHDTSQYMPDFDGAEHRDDHNTGQYIPDFDGHGHRADHNTSQFDTQVNGNCDGVGLKEPPLRRICLEKIGSNERAVKWLVELIARVIERHGVFDQWFTLSPSVCAEQLSEAQICDTILEAIFRENCAEVDEPMLCESGIYFGTNRTEMLLRIPNQWPDWLVSEIPSLQKRMTSPETSATTANHLTPTLNESTSTIPNPPVRPVDTIELLHTDILDSPLSFNVDFDLDLPIGFWDDYGDLFDSRQLFCRADSADLEEPHPSVPCSFNGFDIQDQSDLQIPVDLPSRQSVLSDPFGGLAVHPPQLSMGPHCGPAPTHQKRKRDVDSSNDGSNERKRTCKESHQAQQGERFFQIPPLEVNTVVEH